MTNQFLKQFAMIIFTLLTGNAIAQFAVDGSGSIALQVTYNKTSTILFPAAIKNANRGSGDVLARKVNAANNVLQVKSAKKQLFPETNLTVLTVDGKLYHFIVNYADNPEHLNLQVLSADDKVKESMPPVFRPNVNELQIKRSALAIMKKKGPWMNFNHQRKNDIGLSLEGIYIQGNVMFYHLKVSNASNIGYDVDMLRFYVNDKKNLKRTAAQEIPIKPLYVYKQKPDAIEGQSSAHFVYVLEKMTIPEAKNLIVEMFERNGGRHLQLQIGNKTILKAKNVPLR